MLRYLYKTPAITDCKLMPTFPFWEHHIHCNFSPEEYDILFHSVPCPPKFGKIKLAGHVILLTFKNLDIIIFFTKLCDNIL